MSIKIYTFIVTGNTPFPFDMLRHDQCWPATVDDVVAMLTWKKGRYVTLHTVNKNSPDTERWAGFFWSVERKPL